MDISANGPVSDRGRYRVSELPAHHFASLDDDAIGDMASRAAASEVPWIPDVTAAVTDRLARDAAAYPEVFVPGSRPPPAATQMTSVTSASGLSQTRGTRRSDRLPQLAVVAGVVAVCVVGAAVLLGDWDRTSPTAAEPGGRPPELALQLSASSAPLAQPAAGFVEPLTLAPAGADAEAREAVEVAPLMITAARPLRDGRLGARVAFGATAARAVAEPHRTQLLRKRSGRTWKLVGWAEREGPVETTLVPGKRYEFKVRTLDEAGNVLTSERLRAVLTVRDWASRQLRRTPGDWTTTTGDPRRGEPVDGALASRTADAAITTSFQGDGVALVAPVGPAGGAMRVRLDGGDWVRGELSHAEPAERAIVFSRYLRGGAHSLDIGVADGVIALDSMMILRIPRA